MKTDANVVHLNKMVPDTAHPAAARLPASLIQVRDRAATQLKQALQALFDNADDTLFDMADRATSNAEQNSFFEAMRDLRLKRKGIERGFLQRVFEAFAGLNQHVVVGKAPTLDAVSFDSLSLVQNDELEETVALDSMIAKVLSRDQVALTHLTTRLNAIVSKKLDDKSNPLGPVLLSELFLESCSGLGVEIKVKLIILKLFEKYVLSGLEQLYSDSNAVLVEAGVLPELKAVPARRSRPERSDPLEGFQRSGDMADDEVREVFGALQELLSQTREGIAPRRQAPANAMPISTNDLMRLLSHLQQRAPIQAPMDVDLRAQLEHLLTRASAKSGRVRVVGEVDEDVINLVSMLFEFILDDRSLPDSLKALIARLQIPMLKVAVLDKTFFSRGSHPARRLLNEIATAALGWGDHDSNQRDSLYQKIEQVVQRLLNDFTDDPAIFSELLADFLAFTGDERRRSELLEQRTRDAEEGSARAEMARREVEQALNDRLLGKTLPEVVVRLLREAWSKVMMLTCLKHGTDSEQWQSTLATMDDLIWSVEPHENPEARLRLLELVPGLLKALREGMASAAFDPFSTSEFFSQLEALHVQAFQRFKRAIPDVERPAPTESDEVQRLALSAVGIELPLLDLQPEEESSISAMVEIVEEIVLEAPGQPRSEPQDDPVLAEDDESLRYVDALRVGSWVEFQEDDEHKLRCKLAAIIKPTGKYIFVNRTGMKVLEKTRMGLAVEFRRNAVRLLDDALLFDRALESVIGNLRRLKGA
ncbi:uncharacterized protein DUF1631 [Pseudomonas sp. URMO17WK12:I1]|uniref:DUF1631 domain-containing protein n=1 Tax=unclassified Pseudomonas TaxID=196821 RepID=UPI00048055C1|nr:MULTISPECIES: DUF1631 domain-containing protein [unclassified Pseudomonas]PZW70110.1 uncharacterized protein DUF1631 [Pseudomonas sp. URMO17WK12:I1]